MSFPVGEGAVSTTETVHIPRRKTIVEVIAEELIRYIASNGLKGGDRLPSERQFVDMLGATRLPLREALSVLKGLGIIEARHGKGVFVKQLDLAGIFGMLSPLLRSQADIDLRQLFEARFYLEGSVAELAAANCSEEDLQALEASVEGMRASVTNRPAYMRYDTTFHQELARSTGNPIFHVFMASITDLLAELQCLYQDDVGVRLEAAAEHAAILEAIRDRDGAQAKAAMKIHLRNATERIQ